MVVASKLTVLALLGAFSPVSLLLRQNLSSEPFRLFRLISPGARVASREVWRRNLISSNQPLNVASASSNSASPPASHLSIIFIYVESVRYTRVLSGGKLDTVFFSSPSRSVVTFTSALGKTDFTLNANSRRSQFFLISPARSVP